MGLMPDVTMMLPNPMYQPPEPENVIEPDGADEPLNTRSPEERLGDLMTLFTYADEYREQRKEQALEWYRLFVGHRDELPDDLKGRSNLHIPLTNETVDTLRARMFKAYFGTQPYVDFKPKPQTTLDIREYDKNLAKAKLAAALVNEQFEKNKIQKKWYSFCTSLLVFPAAILGVGWRYETRKVPRKQQVMMDVPMVQQMPDGSLSVTSVRQPIPGRFELVEQEAVVWDDNEIHNIDFWDFWVDPTGWDIDSCRYVWHRVWMTRPQIQRELELLRKTGIGEVTDVDWDSIAGTSEELFEGQAERLSSIGYTHPTTDAPFGEEDMKRLGRYEVLHYWEDGRHAIIINRAVVAYDGPNPYWRHGKKPFCVATFDPLPGEFYGLSAVQLIEHLQAELNTIRNQRIDNASFCLNKMWGVNPSADIDESELVSRPNGIIHMQPNDAWPIQIGDVNQSSYQEEIIVRNDMENVLGVPAIVRGVTPSRKETATEVITKNNNASIRFDAKIMLIEDVFKRLAYLMDCNNQQFISQERVVRQYGPDGAEEWATIEPDALIGEWDYIPAGSSIDPAANRDIRREQLMQLVMYATPQTNPYLDLYELTRQLMESMDVRGVNKALRTPDQVKAKQMQEFQEQMQMQQMIAQQQAQAQQAQAQQAQMAQQQAMMQPSPEQMMIQAAMQQAPPDAMGIPAQVPDQSSIPPQALAMLALSEGVPA